jgi:hypothetical protein
VTTNPIIGTIEIRTECEHRDPHREEWPINLDELDDQPKACVLAAPELHALLTKAREWLYNYGVSTTEFIAEVDGALAKHAAVKP